VYAERLLETLVNQIKVNEFVPSDTIISVSPSAISLHVLPVRLFTITNKRNTHRRLFYFTRGKCSLSLSRWAEFVKFQNFRTLYALHVFNEESGQLICSVYFRIRDSISTVDANYTIPN
jgi:hypothetical protein